MFQVNPEYIISDMKDLTTKTEGLKTLLANVDRKVLSLTNQGWVGDASTAYYSKINAYVKNADDYLDQLKTYFGNISNLAQKSIESEQQMMNSLK